MIISKSRMIKSLDQTWGGTDDHWIGFRNNTQETHGSWPSKYSCFRICFILYVQIREVARSFLSRWISEGLSVYHPKSWNLDTGRKNEGYNQHGDLTSQRDVRTRNIPMISRNHQQRRGMVYCPTFFPNCGVIFRHLSRWIMAFIYCDHRIIWSTWNRRMMGLGSNSTPLHFLRGHEQSGQWIFLR